MTMKIKEEKQNIMKKFLNKVKDKELIALSIPVFAYFIIFHYLPMYGILICFQRYYPALGVWGSDWVGLENFKAVFSNPAFYSVFKNTIVLGFTNFIFNFPLPIILALMLNELRNQKFKKIIQNFTYIPHFISMVVMCGMVKMFTMDTGIVGSFFQFFGKEPVTLLNYPQYFLPVYVISDIWQQVGWKAIIYTAALTSVDNSQIEAAQIDGAGKWKQTIHVTLPAITPTIVTMLILNVGSIVAVGYEKIILLYNDATMEVADVISSYTYRMGLLNSDWSTSTTVGIFNSVLNFMLLILTNSISRKVNETSLW